MILSSQSSVSSTIARVWISGNGLYCSFKEDNETFRKHVKSVELAWSEQHRAWCRTLNIETAGAPQDRAAELAARLIDAGFTCEINNEIAEAVRAGTWTPEQKRWVKYIEKKYHLWWRGQDENLYHRALMLPEAAWDTGTKSIAVPALYFAEVLGFADEHDFRFTKTAQESIESSRREYQRMILPDVPAPKKIKKAHKEYAYELDKFRDLPRRALVTKTNLLPHQVPAVENILSMRVGALFMDMGTGKTRCAIELVARRQARISKVIWFCPVSLKLTIAAEIAKHTDGEIVEVVNGETLQDAFWYIVGIESMSSSDRIVLAVHDLIDQDTFVIVDESSYIKGHASKRSMRIADISAAARYRLLLTGTPITQGVGIKK